MSTEKLGKVYFWRNGVFSGFSHHTFKPLLEALEIRTDFHRMFNYKDTRRFANQKTAIFDLASRLQNLAPAGGNIGPNSEYPWPPKAPTNSPLSHPFAEWQDWNETTAGRRLRYFVENLLQNYSTYLP